MDHIVLDVEVSTDIERLPNAWDDTHLMEIAVAAVLDTNTGRFRLYDNDQRSQRALRERIQKADRITTYNGWSFDFPVIMGFERKGWLSGRMASREVQRRSDALFTRIQSAAEELDEFRPRKGQLDLGSVCELNLGEKKTGHGSEVTGLVGRGRFAEVASYCMDDVWLTKELSDHIDRTGRVAIKNKRSTLVLNVRNWNDD